MTNTNNLNNRIYFLCHNFNYKIFQTLLNWSKIFLLLGRKKFTKRTNSSYWIHILAGISDNYEFFWQWMIFNKSNSTCCQEMFTTLRTSHIVTLLTKFSAYVLGFYPNQWFAMHSLDHSVWQTQHHWKPQPALVHAICIQPPSRSVGVLHFGQGLVVKRIATTELGSSWSIHRARDTLWGSISNARSTKKGGKFFHINV